MVWLYVAKMGKHRQIYDKNVIKMSYFLILIFKNELDIAINFWYALLEHRGKSTIIVRRKCTSIKMLDY
ncbi:unnamed protein product [Blepharisma stoltei]|uniref:Uncharacterized protein n=1 Tax=Blepharisma stoltei TaxID=1481888 RepID=A0AAU9IZN9_9CILI|nr:unnamed protein product [Blepharisma stoltei]